MEIEHTVYFAVGVVLIVVIYLIKKFAVSGNAEKVEPPVAAQQRGGRPAAQRQAAIRNRRGARNQGNINFRP